MKSIKSSPAQKKAIAKSIQNDTFYNNEKVWTFFLAHAILNSKVRKQHYLRKLLNENVKIDKDLEIWCEAEPLPPRKGVESDSEGNTKLDMAFGDIGQRDITKAGIEFLHSAGWVCFVEAKLFSDCSSGVLYDPFRNQLARVIENLITFQKVEKNKLPSFPQKTFFTLLTPRIFKEHPHTKLYGYKYSEFQIKGALEKEFENCRIEKRNIENGWKYPDNIRKRLTTLKFNWVAYEDILEEEYNCKIDLSQKKHKGTILMYSEIKKFQKTLNSSI